MSPNNIKNSSKTIRLDQTTTNEKNLEQKLIKNKLKPLIIQINNSFNPFHKNN